MTNMSQASLHATGFAHPPDIKPVQRHPGAAVEWHKAECPAPEGKCLLGLKTGCAAPPAPPSSDAPEAAQ